MDLTLQEIIDRLQVVVITAPLDHPGYYLPDLNTIYVDEELDEQEHEMVLLHELGHAAKHKNELVLYHATVNMKLKMEYGANSFMIEHLFNKYVNATGTEPAAVNYLDFMKQVGIPEKHADIVKKIISKY